MKPHLLKEVGQQLHGWHWQRPLAKTLGRYHPDGERDSIDDRLMRRWAAGHLHIPDWVAEALHRVVARRAMALTVMAERLRQEQTKKEARHEGGPR